MNDASGEAAAARPNEIASPSKPRRRRMKRADRRGQLLKVARNIVRAEGVGALTMTAMAEAAGVAKTVVYSHFADSREIALALLDEHFIAANRYVQEQTKGARSFEEYISLLIDSAFAFQAMSETPVRKITSGFEAGDAVNKAFLDYEERFQTFWSTLLGQLDLTAAQIEVMAFSLGTMANDSVYKFALSARSKDARELLKTLIIGGVHAVAPKTTTPFKPPSFSDDAARGGPAPNIERDATQSQRRSARVRGVGPA